MKSFLIGFACLSLLALPPRSAHAQVNTLAAASPGARESKSLALDGSTTYAQVPVNPAINVTGPFTAEAWVKFNNTTGVYQSIFERYGTPDGTGRNGGFYLRVKPDGRLEFAVLRSIQEGVGVQGGTALTGGVWHHVAGVCDGSQLRVYLDGQLDGVLNYPYLPATGSTSLFIGSGNWGGGRINGLLDEARLTAAALYASGFAPRARLTAAADTRGLWKFDNDSPIDFSGYGNDCNFVGGASFSTDVPPAGPDDGEPVVPPPGPDAEPPALINFDNLEHGTLVGGQYPGAFFSAGGFRAPAVWDFRVISHNFREAVSPPCSLSRKNTGDSSWDHFSPITVDFTRPVNNLKFNTTSIDAPAGTIVARVDVFQSGTYTRTINIPSFGWGTYTTYSFAPTGEFPSGINDITRIVINQTRDAFGAYADDQGLTYDDFSFTPALSVNITSPRASGNIQGTTQTALPGADLVLRADTNSTGGAYRWTFTGPITVSGGSVDSNTVTLRATDAGAVTARVTYTMNGYTVASSVNINVVLPRLTAFSAVEAADRIISPDVEQCQGLPLLHTAYMLGCPYYVFQAPEHVPGIKFTAVAALPAGPYLTDPAQGGIKFVQIMSSLRKAMLYGGPVCETSRPLRDRRGRGLATRHHRPLLLGRAPLLRGHDPHGPD